MKELKVLIIEDSEDDALLLCRHLERAGYRLHAVRVETAEGLKRALAEGGWDIALSDNKMPEFSALAALDILKQSDISIPFIIISGTIGEETAVEAMCAGATDYLMKGSLTRFVPAVERALQAAENLRARRRAEEALRASEAELRVIFEAMTDVVVILDREGRYQKVAPTGRALFYSPPDGAPGKTLHEVFPKEKADLFLEYIQRALREGRMQRVEYSLELGGEEVWFDSSVSPMSEDTVVWFARDITERKRAENSLHASEAKYRQIVETANEGIWMIDTEGKTLFANRRVAEMLGTTVEEMLGQSAFQFVFEEDLVEAQRRLGERKKGARGQSEFCIRRKDGSSIYTLSNISPLNNEAGEVLGILAMLSDITERKRAEATLQEVVRSKEESLALLDTILTSAPIGFAFHNSDLLIERINVSLAAVTGLTVGEILGHSLHEVMPTMADKVEPYLRHVLETGEPVLDIELSGKQLAAPWRQCYWLASYYPVRMQGGELLGVGALVSEITERKRVEEQLRQSESQLAEAQQLAHVGSWNWDLQTNTLTWSDELYRIYGFNPHEFEPTYELFVERMHPDDRDSVQRVVECSLKHLEPFNYYKRIIQPNGEVRILYSRGTVVGDERGRPVRMFGTAQDVTELRRAEEQLQSSNDELRALAARLQSVREEESLRIAREIHDELGGALTGLKMDLAWLDKRLAEPNRATKQQKMRSMLELIDETIQKVRNIATELRPAILDDLGLAAAIEWQAREFQNRTEIECRIISLHEDITLSSEKATAVFRIFQEILTNVSRHACATLVEIRMEKQNGDLILEVSDNGRGITESEIADTKSLGLLGMRERAMVFGGRVHITDREGKGTRVTICIPHD